MTDHQSLIVRELPLTDVRELLEGPPAPPTGFSRRSETSVVAVGPDGKNIWVASYAHAQLTAFGRVLARAVLVGVPRAYDGAGDPSLEACYRALLDFILAGHQPPQVVVIEVLDRQEDHVDVLWRLALAANLRLTIGDAGDRIHVQLFAPGRGGDLAALVATRPHALAGAALRSVREASSRARGDEQQTLAVVACDVDAPMAALSPRAAVEFSELPTEAVRRRPRRFGVGLVVASQNLSDRHQIVGRIGGRIVFQLACHRSAPALGLLTSAQRAQLAGPIALISDAHTAPEFRNRSIFAAGLQWTAQWARLQGIRTLVMLILLDNLPSLRAAARAGFRRIGEVTVLR